MFSFSLKELWRAIVAPKVRLPAEFPFSPKDSGKLYLKSLVWYITGTLMPLGLFMGLMAYLVKYNLPLADVVLDQKNFFLLIAGFSVFTFLSGFGAQFFYVRKQIHKQGRQMRDVLFLNRKHFEGSTLRLLGWGVLTAVIAAVVQQGIAWVWPMPIKDPTAEMINSMHGLSFAMMAALCVIGPIFEEIIFRGFLFNSIRSALHKRLPAQDTSGYGARVAIYDLISAFSSALVFGLAHMNLAGLPLYVAIGMILSEAYRRSGSLYVPIIGHFLNNGTVVLLMILTR